MPGNILEYSGSRKRFSVAQEKGPGWPLVGSEVDKVRPCHDTGDWPAQEFGVLLAVTGGSEDTSKQR